MDIKSVRQAYRACDRGEVVSPDQFRSVAFAYAIQEPDAARTTARLYHQYGAGRTNDLPLGDADYVGELFGLALRQPRDSQVSKLVAMAVGMSIIPDDELGKATKEDRYLTLHAAAQLAQSFAANLGKSLSQGQPKQQQAGMPAMAWVALAIGIIIVIALLN